MVAVKPFFIYIDISKLYSYGKVDPFGQAKRPAQIFAHRREWQNGSQLARISDIIWKNKLAIIHTEVIWMRDRILNYWYEQEFFNPCWPVEPKQDVNLTTHGEPWAQTNNNPLVRTAYDVYLGWGKTRDLIGWMLEALRLDAEESAIEAENSATCLCAMKLNENGQYIADSFAISSFAGRLHARPGGFIPAKLDAAELEKLQHAWNDALLQRQKEVCEPAFSKEKLLVLFGEVCGGLGVADGLLKSALWAREKKQHANKKGEFPPLDPSTELLQSFYLKDMEAIRKAPTKTVSVYVQAMVEPVPKAERVQIDTDTEQMRRWLRADAFPLGAWPSQYSPSLMQQLGINLAVSGEQRIFSVNGPPGTGKTTLLKEIIASNVVERAIRMAEYAAPDDAFRKQAFQAPPDQYNQSYYKLNQDLSAYGILVASNNNAAVENISMELPKAIQEDRTGRFSGAGRQTMEETYFADVATELLGEPAWGLISAKLGKKGHLKALKDRLWWAKEGATLRCHYAEETVDWNAARERFAKALQAVRDEQEKTAQAQALLAQQEDAAEARKRSVAGSLQRTSAPGGKPKRADGSGTQACAPAGKRCPAQKRRPFPQTHPPVSEGSYGKEMAGDGAGCAGDAHPGDATQKAPAMSRRMPRVPRRKPSCRRRRNLRMQTRQWNPSGHGLAATGRTRRSGKTSVQTSLRRRPAPGRALDSTERGRNCFTRH